MPGRKSSLARCSRSMRLRRDLVVAMVDMVRDIIITGILPSVSSFVVTGDSGRGWLGCHRHGGEVYIFLFQRDYYFYCVL